MSGLSSASAQRLGELEKQPELGATERGQLRAMAQSCPSPDERSRLLRLLSGTRVATPAPTPDPPAPTGSAYERGMQRAKSASRSTYTT